MTVFNFKWLYFNFLDTLQLIEELNVLEVHDEKVTFLNFDVIFCPRKHQSAGIYSNKIIWRVFVCKAV